MSAAEAPAIAPESTPASREEALTAVVLRCLDVIAESRDPKTLWHLAELTIAARKARQ